MPNITYSFAAHAIGDALPELADGPLIVFAASKDEFGGTVQTLDAASSGGLMAAAQAAKFKAGWGESVKVLALKDAPASQISLVGIDPDKAKDPEPHLMLGGKIAALLSGKANATIVFDDMDPADAAAVLGGIKLGSYKFDRYKSQPSEDNGDEEETPPKSLEIAVLSADEAGVKAAFADADAIASGTILARDLVNEPPNVLGPIEFAGVAESLSDLGVEVTVLDTKAMTDLGMNALLGVAQGSERPGRMAIMEWKGGKEGDAPVAIVGKGVVFDTGGISIKPSGGMEDMKGDMGGAACVVGLMHTLAARKANANVVGVIGLVENMPDGKAQRPGDIVTSMAGKTIEIINTDAEGRLVLADALHYTNVTYSPKVMINLATLTGAILVALGKEYAGLFSNDDDLATDLHEAGQRTGEKVWRMPIGPAYDKMINSQFADMKNTGGRFAGSITAAQFLHRFVGETPWAHLDVAGTAMAAPKTSINNSFGSGFGVRLLDNYIRAVHEQT